MDDELEEIKRRKLEELKIQYMNRGKKNMEENMPNTPLHMTDADIDENIRKYPEVIIDCWAPWCGPCRMISPIIDNLAQEMQGKIVFGRLNVDENRSTASKYNIMSIPSLLVFKNGQLADVVIGAMPKAMLKAKLAPYM